jgi:hypothetical protein
MSSNLLRLDFARTFRDYPISGTCVKRRKLIALVLCLFALTGFPVLEKPGKAPNFERPCREQNSRGRLTAHEEF